MTQILGHDDEGPGPVNESGDWNDY